VVCLFCHHLEEERLNTAARGGAYALRQILLRRPPNRRQHVRAGRGNRPRGNPQTQEGTFRRFRDEFGHTPLSIEEKIPWKCHRLVIGTGAYGRLPVMKEVKFEAERRHIELVIVPTS
jgi:hypothetical protein